MKKRTLVLVLTALLTLTAGCGMKKAEPEPSSNAAPGTVALTVDGREVPAWRYLYWLAYDRERLTEQYRAAGFSGEGKMTVYYVTSFFREMMIGYMKNGRDVF